MPKADQGSPVGRYTFVPRTLVFLTRGDQILLIKGAAHKHLWAGLYNAIGGHVERGEDILTSARREVMEETGLEPAGLRICGVVSIDTAAESGILVFVLRAECPHGDVRPSQEGQVEWVALDDLENRPLVEDLPILLPRVLYSQPGDPPFSALYTYDASDKLVIRFADQETSS